MDLRPLGFGEIFDRAITLYVRNFAAFGAIMLALFVPLTCVQYAFDAGQGSAFDGVLRATHPSPGAPPGASFGATVHLLDMIVLVFLVGYLLLPFALEAVAVGVARNYAGQPIGFRACYRAVTERWPSVLGVVLLQLLVFLGWYLALSIIVGFTAGSFMLFGGRLAGAASVALSLLIIAEGVAMMAVVAPLSVEYAFALYAVIFERRSAGRALAVAFSRVFRREEFWRSMLFGLACAAAQMLAVLWFALLADGALLLRWTLPAAMVGTAGNLLVWPLIGALGAYYYFDVRVRYEAYDLETELDRLPVTTAAELT